MIYYNETKNIYYTSGSSLTINTEDGVFSGIPTLEQLNDWGFEEYVEPQPVIEPVVETYKEMVVRLIRERYDTNDEIALLRQKDVKPEEFEEYNNYCEHCKSIAREATGENEESL